MNKIFYSAILFILSSLPLFAGSEENRVLSLLNIGINDADSLVSYFRKRNVIYLPGVDLDRKNSDEEQKWADDALEHRFFVHTGYRTYFYGKDINWEYWPVKDNELRWQLHRMKWWIPLGRAYRASGDEKYAKEWTDEYVDWIKKNPLGNYTKPGDLLSADNMYFAWRPLEVSDRLENQLIQFSLFLPSKHFDGKFLLAFLDNYHRHCEHIMSHFTPTGNHLLFEAQRLLYAAIFFPEFKDAEKWKKTAITILNDEIKKQVYSDGIQFELDPHYHLESINIFFKALRLCNANGMENVFPREYVTTVHKMIEAVYNYSYPDYANPMFSDFHGQHDMIPLYKAWAEVFKNDPMIRYLATKGLEGHVPDYLSRAFPVSGFYCLRNGWNEDATIMVMKSGPKGEWHCQPDNGTFEYWRKGRNFFPDSGGYVYGGDDEILKMRNWFRQTSVHNTLTLDDKNIETADSHMLYWNDDSTNTVVTVKNVPYSQLEHIRTVIFDKKTGGVVIKDTVSGQATGMVALHYNLLPSKPKEYYLRKIIKTTFSDGNNILLKVRTSKPGMKMKRTEGRVSYEYRQYTERPAYNFSVYKKPSETIVFTTEIIPL